MGNPEEPWGGTLRGITKTRLQGLRRAFRGEEPYWNALLVVGVYDFCAAAIVSKVLGEATTETVGKPLSALDAKQSTLTASQSVALC